MNIPATNRNAMNSQNQVETETASLPNPIAGRCTCKRARKIVEIGYWEGCPLEGGAHTEFALLRCQDCGKVRGFPDGNLDIALERGTEKTKAKLREILCPSNLETNERSHGEG